MQNIVAIMDVKNGQWLRETHTTENQAAPGCPERMSYATPSPDFFSCFPLSAVCAVSCYDYRVVSQCSARELVEDFPWRGGLPPSTHTRHTTWYDKRLAALLVRVIALLVVGCVSCFVAVESATLPVVDCMTHWACHRA